MPLREILFSRVEHHIISRQTVEQISGTRVVALLWKHEPGSKSTEAAALRQVTISRSAHRILQSTINRPLHTLTPLPILRVQKLHSHPQSSPLQLQHAATKGHVALLTAHQADFRAEFRRMWITLGGSSITSISGGVALTPSAYAMHYMYTRFQILSSSRNGTSDRPNALQGIWTPLWTPQNQGSYFLNENVEKMYAAMEMQNIANSGDPLWKWLANLAENGKKSAAGDFGYTDGSWSTAHYSDIWVATTLRGGGSPSSTNSNEYVVWPFGGIWTMNQIYDHYGV